MNLQTKTSSNRTNLAVSNLQKYHKQRNKKSPKIKSKPKPKKKNAGTKHIDPDTGLIYFKYDFGYEFGIVLPGEGKKTVTSTNRTIQGQRRASDIEVPIVHEFTTTRRENGFAKRSSSISSSTRQGKPTGKFGASKTVKWEPTSESEFSEAEDARNARKRQQDGGSAMAPPSLVIPCSPSPSRWDHTTPSPLSLSPSLPSLSPRYSSATGPPSNVDSAGIHLLLRRY